MGSDVPEPTAPVRRWCKRHQIAKYFCLQNCSSLVRKLSFVRRVQVKTCIKMALLLPSNSIRLPIHQFIQRDVRASRRGLRPSWRCLRACWKGLISNERLTFNEGINRICRSLWARIDHMYLENLYESMPRRMQKVNEAKGGHTK